MIIKREDILAGGLFILTGAGFATYAALTLNIGTASKMGSGFFPVMLGFILAALGLAIIFVPAAARSLVVADTDETLGPIPWRAITVLTLAPILFALTVRNLGLALSVAICVAFVCLASPRMTLKMGVGVTIGLTALCILIFSYGLRLPLPLLPSFVTG